MLSIEEYIEKYSSAEDPLLRELHRQTHLRFVNPNMSSGHSQGLFLSFISEMVGPERILEIGTYTGYSAICLARGLKPGGRLFTIEINDELVEFSSSYFRKAGLGETIIQITGDALTEIGRIGEQFDLVFIDGDKREYTAYYNTVFPHLKRGGYIIADNTLWGEKVLSGSPDDQQTKGIREFNEMIRKQENITKVILPLRDGLTLIRKA